MINSWVWCSAFFCICGKRWEFLYLVTWMSAVFTFSLKLLTYHSKPFNVFLYCIKRPQQQLFYCTVLITSSPQPLKYFKMLYIQVHLLPLVSHPSLPLMNILTTGLLHSTPLAISSLPGISDWALISSPTERIQVKYLILELLPQYSLHTNFFKSGFLGNRLWNRDTCAELLLGEAEPQCICIRGLSQPYRNCWS